MKRTALYYPTVAVPEGSWLRATVLYWDEVASIVPQDWDDHSLVQFTSDIDYLAKEHVFRAIRPDAFVMHGPSERLAAFHEELRERMTAPNFRVHLAGGEKHLDARIHRDKVATAFFYEFLEPDGLARRDPGDSRWLLFERRAALLYMSCLAKYIADADPEAVTPSTDAPIYESLSLDALQAMKSLDCVDVELRKVLPVPRGDVALSDILDFKRRRHAELLRFRELIDRFHKDLAKATTPGDLKETIASIGEQLETGLGDLRAVLKDAQLATVLGSVKSIVSLKSPSFWGALFVTAGVATPVPDLPLGWAGAGVALMGSIEIGYHLIDSRNEARAAVRDSGFAYLYRAQGEGIL